MAGHRSTFLYMAQLFFFQKVEEQFFCFFFPQRKRKFRRFSPQPDLFRFATLYNHVITTLLCKSAMHALLFVTASKKDFSTFLQWLNFQFGASQRHVSHVTNPVGDLALRFSGSSNSCLRAKVGLQPRTSMQIIKRPL